MNIPEVTFKCRVLDEENGYQWKNITTQDFFLNKKVILFSVPGAFTPTCSTKQLPEYEKHYDDFIDLGFDEVYCMSVNDAFVMNAWFKSHGIEKVKPIPDGNGEFTYNMGMSVAKTNLGFGHRSWRYAAIIENGDVTIIFSESGKNGNTVNDPYEVSDPVTVLNYLSSKKDEEEAVVNYA